MNLHDKCTELRSMILNIQKIRLDRENGNFGKDSGKNCSISTASCNYGLEKNACGEILPTSYMTVLWHLLVSTVLIKSNDLKKPFSFTLVDKFTCTKCNQSDPNQHVIYDLGKGRLKTFYCGLK